jgi:hypothetical protein
MWTKVVESGVGVAVKGNNVNFRGASGCKD